MLQYKLKLSTEFNLILKNCDELWVASAMVSDYGFNFIQGQINKFAKQHYLVGIDLPSSPKVLSLFKELELENKIECRIHHNSGRLFHPKVYIIRTNEKLIAYVGSGNCTEGGFDRNLELSVKIEEQDFCNNLLIWFNSLFKFGKPITEEFLNSYNVLFESRKERIKQDRKELNTIFPESNLKINLDEIDFTNQFFKKEHYKAFEGNKPFNQSDTINQERLSVRKQLYKLHDNLLPKLNAKIWDLHHHYDVGHIVSSAEHSNYTGNEIDALWIHYGRNEEEIKEYGKDETPLDFMRLQVIIHKDCIGIWNRVGKDRGSKIDRDNLKEKLINNPDFRYNFYSIISNLPDNYYITINDTTKYIKEFANERELTDFILMDNIRYYFIIGIDYSPDDVRISKDNIIDTIIENFEKLYPTYALIKHQLNYSKKHIK